MKRGEGGGRTTKRVRPFVFVGSLFVASSLLAVSIGHAQTDATAPEMTVTIAESSPSSTSSAPASSSSSAASPRSAAGERWGAAASRPSSPRPIALPLDALGDERPSIRGGQRIERRPEGRWLVSDDSFPPGGEARSVALPARWGGGYLFYQPLQSSNETATALWWGRDFTGPLEPLGRVTGVFERIEPGFDRFYLFGHGDVLAFDPIERRVTSLAPLPPVPTIEGLSFGEGASVALEAPLVGVLVSNDGGLSFRSVEGVSGLEDTPLGPVVRRDGVRSRWLADGSLEPLRAPSRASRARALPEAEMIERVLLEGSSSGEGAEGAGSAGRSIVGFVGARWLRLDLHSGVSIATGKLEFDPGRCRGVEASPPRFLCLGDETRWIEFDRGKLRVLAALPGARRVLALGERDALLAGACDGAPQGACLFGVDGARALAVSTRAAAFGLDGSRSATLSFDEQGRVVIEESRVTSTGAATRAAPQGASVAAKKPKKARALRRVYEVPSEEEQRLLFREGVFVREMKRHDEGWSAWLTRGDTFVGVLFDDEGHVTVGPVQKPTSRALFAGRHALSWGAAGFAKETSDGGLTWREVALPFQSGDADPNVPSGARRAVTLGCGEWGCALGGTLRLGWSRGDTPPPTTLPVPDKRPIPPPGGGRFRLTCRDATKPAARASSSGTRAFWGRALPSAGVDEARVSVDALEELGTFWALGPKNGSWGRAGRAALFYRDPFAPEAVKSSRVTVGLFRDGIDAERTMGLLEAGTTTIQITLAARGDGGLLLASGRSHVDLFSFTDGGPVERIAGANELGLRRLHGVVRSRGKWFTAEKSRDRFSVLELDAAGIREIASLPLGAASGRHVDLVGTSEGDLGVAIDGDRGLFVYPLLESGRLGQAIVVPHLGAHPPTCAPDAPGYVVVRELSIAPFVEGARGPLDVSRVAARYRVLPGRVCWDGLAGRSRGAVEAGGLGPRKSAAAVPLVVADFESSERVATLECE